jgi:hypothetical protein
MIILLAAILLITASFTILANCVYGSAPQNQDIILEKSCNFDFRRATRPTHGLLKV